VSFGQLVRAKIKDYAAFFKMKLTLLVVMSAVLSYFLAASVFDLLALIYLTVGGILVTGASNGFNQILERELDKKMTRTQNRPLPQGRMSVNEATILAALSGVVGILILYFGLNPFSGVLGGLALFMYVAIYTPLKRVTPWAVFVGAFPGAIPPMLGYVAVTGNFGLEPGVLFFVQFMWQFPHFWAIAWKSHDDYQKGGYWLLPSRTGKSKTSAFIILVYTIFLIPASLLPIVIGFGNTIALVLVILMGIAMLYYAVRLFQKVDDKEATRLMFMSFAYLPIVQIAYLIG